MVLVSHEASTVILVINNGHFCRITAILVQNNGHFRHKLSRFTVMWFVQMTVTLISRNNGHFGINNGHFGTSVILVQN